MYIIQVKHDPNMENFVDMADEEEPAAAKQKMKQLVGEYQSEGRIVEVKAEAKMQYSDYFDNDKPADRAKVPKNKIATPENVEVDDRVGNEELKQGENEIIWAKSPCKGNVCAHYNDEECESFADINDPIVNSEGECQGFISKDRKEYILSEINRVADELNKTPTLSEMDDYTDLDQNLYYYYFDGYRDACKKAGLTANSGGRKA